MHCFPSRRQVQGFLPLLTPWGWIDCIPLKVRRPLVLISSLLHPFALFSKGALCVLRVLFWSSELVSSVWKRWISAPWRHHSWSPGPVQCLSNFCRLASLHKHWLQCWSSPCWAASPSWLMRAKMKANKPPSANFQYTLLRGGLPLWSSSRCKAFSQCATVAQASGQSWLSEEPMAKRLARPARAGKRLGQNQTCKCYHK